MPPFPRESVPIQFFFRSCRKYRQPPPTAADPLVVGAFPLLRQQANKVPTLVRASAIVFASCLNYSLPDYLFRIPIVANITPVVCRIIKLRREKEKMHLFFNDMPTA